MIDLTSLTPSQNELANEWIEQNQPAWITEELHACLIQDLATHGCASKAFISAAYLPQASITMFTHGDDVLDFLDHHDIEVDISSESWSGMASEYLLVAIDTWCSSAVDQLIEYIETQEEYENDLTKS